MKLANELDYVVKKFKQIKNLETYAANLKKSGAYDDFETRLGWDCLRATIPTETVCDWYRKYECTDAHITTLVKAALKIVRGGIIMYRQYENPRKLEKQLAELKERYAQATDETELMYLAIDIHELEERVNFAWQDEYQEEDY